MVGLKVLFTFYISQCMVVGQSGAHGPYVPSHVGMEQSLNCERVRIPNKISAEDIVARIKIMMTKK